MNEKRTKENWIFILKAVAFVFGIYFAILAYLTKSISLHLWYLKVKQQLIQLGEFILYLVLMGVTLFSVVLGYFTFHGCLKLFDKLPDFWWGKKGWRETVRNLFGLLGFLSCVIIAILVCVLTFSILTKGIGATFNVNVNRIMDKYSSCGNPYSEDYEEGHYAGFEWAEENEVSSCGGKSDSFIEGCEEYLRRRKACE
jgi:hypothetical protein